VHAFRRGHFTLAYLADPRELPLLVARMGWSEQSHNMLNVYTHGAMLDRSSLDDDATVERVVQVFTEEVELLAVYDEQLGRWRSGPMTVAQRREVERLSGQLARNRDVDVAILTLAENLTATIDAILAKSDLELGLEVLADRSLFPLAPPRRTHP
jgi:hypothetical protein